MLDRNDRDGSRIDRDIMIGNIIYVIDRRTGICFARSYAGNGYYIYSPIECTEKVKVLIVNPER